MFDNRKLGTYIQFLRKSKGLTQSVLADKLGLSPQAVSNWERGESMPDIAMLASLARVLGTTVDRILSAAEDSPLPLAGLENPDEPDIPEEPEESEEPDEPEEPEEKSGPAKPNLNDLSELIRSSVMNALAGLPEQLKPLMNTVKGSIEDALEDIEDSLEDIGDSFEEAREKTRNADRVIVHVHTGKKDDGDDSWKDVLAMAPFASKEALDSLLRNMEPEPDMRKVVSLAPFLPNRTVNRLVKNALAKEDADWSLLKNLAPFCDSLDSILENCDRKLTLREMQSLAPFLKQDTIDRLILGKSSEEKGQNPS
ncbi:MAG: helix-turn-helix domain-containing protein [Oscillospiraceae bacterium]|jgi:transcriptional regulator with XRE-family HTH domain|nr:helix-turn-helix domain-containing protein [Oscillospiraceae bacterium]